MTIEEPGRMSFRTEFLDGKWRITLPGRRNWFVLIVLSLWLCGWAFGELGALGSLAAMAGVPSPLRVGARAMGAGGAAFLSFWLIAWTAGGCWAVYNWLWMFAGREEVTIAPDVLSIARVIPGWSRRKDYRASDVRGLRVSVSVPNAADPSASMRAFGGSGGHCLAFDYGAKTIRFGSLDEAELKMVLAEAL
jgi:hypothetical protein